MAASLRAGRFEEIETTLGKLTDREASDPERGEVSSLLVLQAFDSADPALEPILLEWRQHSPSSPYTAFALAAYYDARAWAARGGRFAKDTPQAAFADFESWKARALPLARSAVDREPRFAEGWRLLIHLALGDPRKCIAIANEGLGHLPSSWRIRAALMNCLRPRWGGRYEAIDAVAAEALHHANQNVHLTWLRSYSAYDRAGMASAQDKNDLAAKWITDALADGAADPQYLVLSAVILRSNHRVTEALDTVDRALAVWPDHMDLLKQRLVCLGKLERGNEAKSVADRMLAVDPVDDWLLGWRSWFARDAREACISLGRSGAVDAAMSRCKEAADLDKTDPESRYWLGRAYLKLEQWDAARESFEDALRADPRHRESIRNLDWLHARTRDWEPVIELWTNYLKLEPGDAGAWLERAGTFRQLGKMDRACDDLRRSCELGNREACTHRDRACR